MAIYITIFRHFKRDEKLAKPQAYEELQECVYETNLGQFISKWDASMEKFLMAGSLNENDEAMLYCLFKRQFLRATEMKDHHAKFARSRSDSQVHSYKWMYEVCRNVVDTLRLEVQAQQRVAGSRPGAADPILPVQEVVGKPDQKTKAEMKGMPCPRAVNGKP